MSYVEGHELPEVHDVVKWVAHFVVHYEFGHHKPSKQFTNIVHIVTDNGSTFMKSQEDVDEKV